MTRAELAALVGAMSEGPWQIGCINYADVYGADGEIAALVPKGFPATVSNAAGIVALRNHAAKLLAVCEAAERLLGDMERGGMYGPLMDALRAALRDLEGE